MIDPWNMGFHEIIEEPGIIILRVPGGWIYTVRVEQQILTPNGTYDWVFRFNSVFVPFIQAANDAINFGDE